MCGRGKDTTDPDVVLSFPPLRRTLFRGVWAEGSNKYYDQHNTSSIRPVGLAANTKVASIQDEADVKDAKLHAKAAAEAKLTAAGSHSKL